MRGYFLFYYSLKSTAPFSTKKLLCKKYALLKKTKQPKSSPSLLVYQLRGAHYYCTTTILLLYCLYVLPTMLRYERIHSTVVPPPLYVYVRNRVLYVRPRGSTAMYCESISKFINFEIVTKICRPIQFRNDRCFEIITPLYTPREAGNL